MTVFKTNDYRSYIGIIEKEDSDSISVKTYKGDSFTFANSSILLTFPFTGRIKNGRLQRRDPNSSFYLFSSSAFAIENGKLYCRDFCLFYPSLNYGLANIISVQAGLFWYPGMDYENTPYVGNLKITAFETNIFSLAAGVTYVSLPVIQEERIYSTGFAFVTGTFGNRYNHASVSAGWGYIQKESEWEREDKPILVAAGNLRLFNSVSFITENWFFPDEKIEDSLLTVALRFFGRQIAVDLGATFTANSIQEKVAPIPVINVTYHLR
ncbi:MAG: hypothetical protein GWP19_07095 [Planctomycetia bacterium]|nr:hypothetical protein [Planctomycetia bacterium]